MSENELSKEELEQLKKDTEEAKQSLKDDAVDRAKKEAKEEAQKEFELKDQLRVQEEERKKSSEEQLEQMKAKLDELAESKAVITEPQNPFGGQPQQNPNQAVDNLSDDQVDDIENASMESFLEERSRGGNKNKYN